ncbi:hypothetical protein SteCoe_21923 [Stentor coeruleus]|uniref:RING-type domain-containing protein n=1 Tax=Stentor coeruleus TaxID=5963 RepID=A0A1R2BNE3_9CILI|nr:hypothetical protein SteCoe_21923 [Stentor coeruleus]
MDPRNCTNTLKTFTRLYIRVSSKQAIYFSFTLFLMTLTIIFPDYSTLLLEIWAIVLLLSFLIRLIVLLILKDSHVNYIKYFTKAIKADFFKYYLASAESFEDLVHEKINFAEKTCSICLDDILVGNLISELKCMHGFHRKCCKKWLKINPVCPVCKFVVSSKQPFLLV